MKVIALLSQVLLICIGSQHARADALSWSVLQGPTIRATDAQNTPLAGESTSAVVPPGTKQACRGGAVFATMDWLRPEFPGVVRGTGLGGGAIIESQVSGLPHPEDYYFGSNDHDLVVLPNGDLLLLWQAFYKASLSPKPDWFDVTYRWLDTNHTRAFGPGARTVVASWISTDCGQTFTYASTFDPAAAADGSCALPQGPNGIGTPPGAPAGRTYYDMGGSDGPTVIVDERANIWLSFQCVGYAGGTGSSGFKLDPNAKLNKTLVAESGNE